MKKFLKLSKLNFQTNNVGRFSRKAFTLAEVLITLGVIGIVAAMTIPVLLQNNQKHSVETQLKEATAILQQVVKMSTIENGNPSSWSLGNSDNDIFANYFVPYLKIAKECSTSEILASTEGICNSRPYSINGDLLSLSQRKYILNNGIGITFASGSTGGPSPRKGRILVDLSKGHGKLILGKNMFTLNFLVNGDKYTISGSSDYNYPTTLCSTPRATQIDYCKSSVAGSNGYSQAIFCTALIECNSWQIPDDYPVNF